MLLLIIRLRQTCENRKPGNFAGQIIQTETRYGIKKITLNMTFDIGWKILNHDVFVFLLHYRMS